MEEKNIYQVFIASSLRLELHRAAAQAAIEEVNSMKEVKDLHIHFDEFIYEKRPVIQKVEEKDAQEKCDAALKQSTIFFLIIDDVIRSLTQYEFEVALKHFDRGELPQEIHIFYDKNKNLKSTTEGKSYDDFKKHENLIFYVPSLHNEIITHSRVYPIPFEAPDDRMDDLKEKMKSQLLAFVNNPDRPFPGAKRGYELTEEHFFTDVRRKKKKRPSIYLRREFDNQLDYAIKDRQLIILFGLSLSGKTRAVMEAMKTVKDGWIYVVKREQAAEELQRIVSYISQEGHPKLYIILDNFDQWTGDTQVLEALKILIGLIGNSHDVIVGTASSKSRAIPNNEAEWIEIKEMDERELAEAWDFFVSAGEQLNEHNLRYRRTGAFFVNLEGIISDYKTWLDDNKDTDLMKMAKLALLKTFKALSIWRDDNMGNRGLMESLATWFCSRTMIQAMKFRKCLWNEADIPSDALDACKQALEDLIIIGNMGVSSAGNGTLVIVQEYIYRYIIDYDGSLLDVGKEFSSEKEKSLVSEVLLFCSETMKQEPLTAQVSRLCRRCAYKKETVSWLYKLWSGEDSSDKPLSDLLNNDRKECEADKTNNRWFKHNYSNLIETYINNCCNTTEEALSAYNRCPKEKRTDHLLSALMRTVKTEKERDAFKKRPDFIEMRNQAYVIAVEMNWADNYRQARDKIYCFAFCQDQYKNNPLEMVHGLLNPDEEMPYTLFQLRHAINILALKVANPEEFDDFCNVVKDLYLYLTNNTRLLNMIENKELSYRPEELTLIDKLAVIQPNILKGMLGNAFGGNYVASKELVDKLIACVERTLRQPFTNEISLRLTIGYVASQLIRKLPEEPYEKVYKGIFETLDIEHHPLHKDKRLILRSIYTYTAMLGNSSCDEQKAAELLRKVMSHTKTDNNPLTINTFTLNKIMEKSKGKNNKVINRMFDELNLQRDAFTYCNLISASKNLAEGLGLLKLMKRQRVEPNIFILGELMKLKDVNLKNALRMVTLKGVDLPERYKSAPLRKIKEFDPNKIINELQEAMSNTHIAWGHLFRKECKGKDDKAVLTACLSYLETKKTELLNGGFIYNCLIANETYFTSINDVMNFIRERVSRKLFHPDSYTVRYVIDRITRLYGPDRLKALDRLNELLKMVMDKKSCKLDEFIVHYRLRIFRNWKEDLKMDFYDEQGNKIVQKSKKGKNKEASTYAALKYIIAMRDNGYSVTSSVIDNYLSIGENIPEQTYNLLIEEIPNLKKPMTPSEYNKSLLRQYKAGEIADIEDAIGNLKWEDTYNAVFTFNHILNYYIHSQPRTPQLFKEVMSHYKKWVGDRDRFPTTMTFSVLAKATACWEDMNGLRTEFENRKQRDGRLTLDPQMLTAILTYTPSVQLLKERTSIMHETGCPYSSRAADAYVFHMARNLLVDDSIKATATLNDLCQYIVVEGGDAEQLLEKDEKIFLMLNLYEKPQNISASLLRTLIYYNASRKVEFQYSVEKIADRIINKYSLCIIPLMEKLAADSTKEKPHLPLRKDMDSEKAKLVAKEVAKHYIRRLFPRIPWDSRPHLSEGLLSYIANGLQPTNLKSYHVFMMQLYRTDCVEIESAVPELVQFLKNYLSTHKDATKDTAAAHKVLAQIIVYVKLKKLRNGHLLLEKIEDKYANWCHRAMDCEKIFEEMESEYKLLSLPDLITRHAIWLDDAYLCSLTLLDQYNKKNKKRQAKPSDEKAVHDPILNDITRCIRQQEQRYTKTILSGSALFKDVLKLPLKWINTQWKPSEELIMAMVRSISQMAYDPNPRDSYNIEDYIRDARERCKAIMDSCKEACEKKKKNVLLYYKDMGMGLPKDNKYFYSISLPTMYALMYDIGLDQMAYSCSEGKWISEKDRKILRRFEKRCAEFIESNGSDVTWLQQLPMRWITIKDKNSYVKNQAWHPDNEIVLAILKNYAQIAQKGEKEDAAIAQKYIKSVKQTMTSVLERDPAIVKVRIKYSMLGIMEDKEYYLSVPLKSLSKIKALNSTSHPSSKS